MDKKRLIRNIIIGILLLLVVIFLCIKTANDNKEEPTSIDTTEEITSASDVTEPVNTEAKNDSTTSTTVDTTTELVTTSEDSKTESGVAGKKETEENEERVDDAPNLEHSTTYRTWTIRLIYCYFEQNKSDIL